MIAPHHSGQNDDEIYRESCPNICDMITKEISKSCRVESFIKRFPIIKWLPKYEKSFLLADFVAGLSVGLTAIPQGELPEYNVNLNVLNDIFFYSSAIAYAVVAGLEPQYGLYSGFMGKYLLIFML